MYCYDYNALKSAVETDEGRELILKVKEIYESEYEKEPIAVLDYTAAKLYYQTGNRIKYESGYFSRRKRLEVLQMLAVFSDEYIEPLEEIISAICDEYTWVLPAHNLIKEENIFDPTIIDLFSAETGFFLAETAFVLGNKLSNDIKSRIKHSLEQKIIKNHESREFNFDTLKNNWAAVCAAGVGGVYLYAFPERFNQVKDRLINSFENYLIGIDEEGYCQEGMGYWVYGFGFFCLFFDVYRNLTGNTHEILSREKVKNAAQYFCNANLGGGEFLPFADGGVRQVKINPHVIYTVKNLFKDGFRLTDKVPFYVTGKALGFRTILGRAKYLPEPKPEVDMHYYENSQVFIYKTPDYSFTAKGGSNHEPHGHCCVGAFQIVKDGKRVICDPGAGEYTYGYFNIIDDSYEGRYGEKIFVCSSFAHSVPIIDGKPQPHNLSGDKAVVLERTSERFKLDISAVYQPRPEKLEVCYYMKDNGVKVNYAYKGDAKSVVFRLVSDYEPTVKDGAVIVEGIKIEPSSGLELEFSKREYSGHYGDKEVAYIIDFKAPKMEEINAEFVFIVE